MSEKPVVLGNIFDDARRVVTKDVNKATTQLRKIPPKVEALAKKELGQAETAITSGVTKSIGGLIGKIPKPVWWFGGAVGIAIMFRHDLERWYGKAKAKA